MNKKIMLLLLILISICAVSHVSAADDNSTVIAGENTDEIQANEDIDEIQTSTDDVKVESESSDVLANTSANTTTTQTGVIKVSKLTTPYKSGTWSIKLLDSNSKGISDAKIALKIYTGSSYKTVYVTTNSNGVASYKTTGLSVGTHKVVLSSSVSGYTIPSVTSSVKVVKQTALKIKVSKKTSKDGAGLTIKVLNKKTKKGMNGVKIKLLIYTGSKLTKTVVLKTKKYQKYKGIAGYATNKLSVGKHKVVIKPVSIKYKGSKKTSMKIKKSAKKYPAFTVKISA